MNGTSITYSGDPRIFLKPNGAEFEIISGQPVIDSGLINAIYLLLFVKSRNDRGFAPVVNAILPKESQLGSDLIDEINKPVTLNSIADVQDAAETALQPLIDQGIASRIEVQVINTTGVRRDMIVKIYKPEGENPLQVIFWLDVYGKPTGVEL